MRELESPLRMLLTVGIGAAAFMGAFRSISTASPRPTPATTAPPVFSADLSSIYAHPGEDPIGLLEVALKNEAFRRSHDDAPVHQIIDASGPVEPTIADVARIVIVGLPGSSAPDLVEFRRRTRFAIHRAALDHDFSMENAEVLSVGTFRPEVGDEPVVFLYETIQGVPKEGAAPTRLREGVLVWVRSEDLGDRPLVALRSLAKRFNLTSEPSKDFPKVILIGPPYSDHLLAFAKEAVQAPQSTDEGEPPLWLQVISPWATVAPHVLVRRALEEKIKEPEAGQEANPSQKEQIETEQTVADDTNGKEEDPSMEELLARVGVKWRPIAHSDGALIELLKAELAARVVPSRRTDWIPPAKDPDDDGEIPTPVPQAIRLLLVHEDSTSYGKFWSAEKNWEAPVEESLSDKLSAWGAEKANFKVIGTVPFERGLDGGAAAVAPSPSDARDPLGTVQLDYYLRRLNIARKSYSLFPSDDEPHAVGVFATDIYDKLLLIRVLNAAFPRAVIFTTDFDERLSMASELPHTRNLVLASQFGPLTIRPSDAYTDATAQSWHWRDWVQEATYLATEATFSQQDPPSEDFEYLRLYEVGNRGMVPLRFRPLTDSDQSAEPAGATDDQILFGVVTAALVLATWFLAWRVYHSLDKARDATQRKERQDLALVTLIAVVGTLALLLSHFAIARSQVESFAEPFSWREGVSIWPTLTIRLFATILLVYGLVLAWVHGKMANLEATFAASARVALLWALPYFGFMAAMYWFQGFPNPPTRGMDSYIWLMIATYLGVFVLTFSSLLGARYTQLAWKRLVDFRREWEWRIEEAKEGWTADFARDLNEMGRMTSFVTRSVWVPATAFGLLFLARWRVLDDWQWNPWIVISILIPATVIIAYLVLLRIHAAQTRRYLLSQLSLCSCAKVPQGDFEKQFKGAKETLTEFKRGAFRPLSEDPIVAAILIPLTMLGGSGWLGSMGVFMGGS